MSRQALERSLPHNIDAEKAVLGSIIVNNENYYRIVEHLEPEDFYLDSHRTVFRHIIELMQNSLAVDLLTLQEALMRQQQLESAGGIAYVAGLMDGIPHLVNVDSYIEIIRGKALLRTLIRESNRTMAAAFDQADAPDAILESAERNLLDISQGRVRSGFVSVGDMQVETQRMLENLYHNRQLVTGVATGFTDLDRLTSGFQPSDLVIIAARPSMGKTALALNIAQQAAIRGGLHVALFSLEMARTQLMIRMLCAESMTDATKVRSGYLSSEELGNLIASLGRIGRAPLYIDDSSAMSIVQMRAKCRRLQQERGLGLVIVDYLQLMSGHGKIENRQQEISSISRGLKSLAKDLRVPVVALAQLSRAPEQRKGDHRPMLSDLRESGSIEQDADIVSFIYREEVYEATDENSGLAEIIIAKQRNGPTGTVKLAYLKQFNKFESLLQGY